MRSSILPIPCSFWPKGQGTTSSVTRTWSSLAVDQPMQRHRPSLARRPPSSGHRPAILAALSALVACAGCSGTVEDNANAFPSEPVDQISQALDDNVGGLGGWSFDDDGSGVVGRIQSIRIRSGQFVNSIQAVYIDQNGGVIQGPERGAGGGFEQTISFEPDEFILAVGGRAGELIDQLSFVTNKKIYGPYGGNGGNPFSFQGKVRAFRGRMSGMGLHAFGVSLKPYPHLKSRDVQYTWAWNGPCWGSLNDAQGGLASVAEPSPCANGYEELNSGGMVADCGGYWCRCTNWMDCAHQQQHSWGCDENYRWLPFKVRKCASPMTLETMNLAPTGSNEFAQGSILYRLTQFTDTTIKALRNEPLFIAQLGLPSDVNPVSFQQVLGMADSLRSHSGQWDQAFGKATVRARVLIWHSYAADRLIGMIQQSLNTWDTNDPASEASLASMVELVRILADDGEKRKTDAEYALQDLSRIHDLLQSDQLDLGQLASTLPQHYTTARDTLNRTVAEFSAPLVDVGTLRSGLLRVARDLTELVNNLRRIDEPNEFRTVAKNRAAIKRDLASGRNTWRIVGQQTQGFVDSVSVHAGP